MMNSKSFSTGVLFVVLAFLGGCGKYSPKPFTSLSSTRDQRNVQNGVSVVARELTETDCRYYFSRRVVAKGYRAVQLHVRNDSQQSYVFNGKDIDLPLVNRAIISKDLHLNTSKRVLTWGIGALFLWPFVIPAACDGIKSAKANKNLNRDFDKRVIDAGSQEVLRPGDEFNKVFFVYDENYSSLFGLGIQEKGTSRTLSFDVRASLK